MTDWGRYRDRRDWCDRCQKFIGGTNPARSVVVNPSDCSSGPDEKRFCSWCIEAMNRGAA